MSLKYILLDLDDTVYDFHKAEHVAISKTLTEFGIEPTESVVRRYSEINNACWRMLEEGIMTREQILVERFRRLFAELSVECDPALVRISYEGNLSECAYMVDGAAELIDALRGRYVLAIASNGTARVQDRRIERGNIAPLFDYIFISERLGATKPSGRFFDLCLCAMGAENRDEVLILGDSLSSDIKGGIGAGIHTCHYNPRGIEYTHIIPEYSIRSLSELHSVIEKINGEGNND